MAKLEAISTIGLGFNRKLDFWNHAVAATLDHVIAQPFDLASFSGRMTRVEVGAMRLAEISSGAAVVTRLPVRGQGAYFVLQQALSGDIICRSDGTEKRLRPGDFRLYDSSLPGTLVLGDSASVVVVRVPRSQILRYIGCPEALTAVVVSGTSGAGALVSRFLRDLWTHTTSTRFLDVAPRFLEIALEMVAGAYAAVPDAKPTESCVAIRHRVRIRAYIEEHLHDPDLTPRSIADAVKLTPGYVHRMFAHDQESIARYILRRRLEECHRALSDPLRVGRSITSIAFDYGFSSLSHFCHAFRDQYGVRPGELRRTEKASSHV